MNCSLVFLWRLYKLHRRVHPRSLSATTARFLRTLATWKGSTVGARRPRPQWWCGNNRDWLGQKVTGMNSSADTSIFSTKALFNVATFSVFVALKTIVRCKIESFPQTSEWCNRTTLFERSISAVAKKLFRKFWEKKNHLPASGSNPRPL